MAASHRLQNQMIEMARHHAQKRHHNKCLEQPKIDHELKSQQNKNDIFELHNYKQALINTDEEESYRMHELQMTIDEIRKKILQETREHQDAKRKVAVSRKQS